MNTLPVLTSKLTAKPLIPSSSSMPPAPWPRWLAMVEQRSGSLVCLRTVRAPNLRTAEEYALSVVNLDQGIDPRDLTVSRLRQLPN